MPSPVEPAVRRLRRLRRREAQLVAAIFVGALWLPLVAMVLGVERDMVRTENRTAAPLPRLTTDPGDLARLPVRYGRYFADHFGFRGALVRLHARLAVDGLGVSPDPRVVLGDSGWLYFAGEGALDVWRGDSLFTDAQLAQWARTLEARRTWLARQGSAYVFTVVPEKPTVYPEHLPPGVAPVSATRRLDQLVAHLRRHTGVRVVDLRPALTAGKRIAPTYQRTDTHWTEFGAWLAYRELLDAVRDTVEIDAPVAVRAVVRDRVAAPGGDLARMLALRDRLRERADHVVERTPPALSRERVAAYGFDPVPLSDAAQRPRVVLFRDSFASYFLPWLAEHVGGVALWQYTFDPAVVRAERPAVVIEEIAERRLMAAPPVNPPEVERAPGRAAGGPDD